MSVSHPVGLFDRLKRVSLTVWLVLLSALMVLGAGLALIKKSIDNERSTAYALALKASSDVVLLDEVRIRSLLFAMEKVTLLLRQNYIENPLLTANQLSERLNSLLIRRDAIRHVSISNAAGDIVLTTALRSDTNRPRLNIADRNYFKVQESAQIDQIFIGQPLISREKGEWVVPITRRIANKQGDFTGTIVVMVPPELFSGTLLEGQLGKNGARALIGLDGFARIRIRNGQVEYGGDSRASRLFEELKVSSFGSYKARAIVDGVPRQISYRLIEPYGVVAIAATAISDIEDSLEERVRIHAVAALLLGVLILTLSTFVIVSFSRHRKLYETEQRYNKLIELIPQLVATLNEKRKVIWVNKQTEDYILGPEKVVPKGFLWVVKSIHSEDLERAEKYFNLVAPTTREPQFHECRVRKFDGEYRWFSLERVPVRNEGGFIKSYLFSATDIHDRKMSEERARVLQRVEAIGLLTGGMAHDFNNLLAIIVGNLDLAATKVNNEQDATRLRVAREAAERGIALVKSLLSLASKQPLMPTVIELRCVVQRISPLLHHALGQRIQMQVTLPDEPLYANVDEAGLEAALLNLCVNAKDAMHHGGSLWLDVRVSHGKALITIKDSGVGMSPEVLRRATEPFFTTKAAGQGTGLGLSMVAGFIKQSKGELHIESTPGVGTAIEISLPRVSRSEKLVPAMEPLIERLQDSNAYKLRILVVDDEPEICIFIREWLKEDGHTVVIAHSADDALTLLGVTNFDILLTDIMMPGLLDGIELAERVANTYPNIKILLMSGYSLATATSRADLPWPLLVKPFGKDDFKAKMTDLFKHSGFGHLNQD